MKILGENREQRLIQLFRRGDATAMDRLYTEYADYLTGVCFRYIADDDNVNDVLQESFIKIFTQIHSFEYRDKGSLKAWLRRIVINESLRFLRTSNSLDVKRLDLEEPDMASNMLVADDPPDTGLVDTDTLASLIASLPPGYRTVLNLYVIDGLSHKEIASQLGIKPDTSASQLHKAKQMLARMIKEYQDKSDKI
ncbi:RNA polymerase sigma factor [Segatella albensis]|uniref:RNA polymerase sigma factor n=1 Tax=Segatella albensis TaxID=77768 RepID=UPI0004698358|nr:RNA polymerase sigma factor [Segatella albensis]